MTSNKAHCLTPELTSKASFYITGRGKCFAVSTNGYGQALFDSLTADMNAKTPVIIDGRPYLVCGIEAMGRPQFAEHFGILVREPPRPKAEDRMTDKPHAIEVDPELTLEYRVSRLEELELLRVGLYQAQAEAEEAHSKGQDPRPHLVQVEQAQQKIAGKISEINKMVRAKLDEHDRRRVLAS